MAKMPQFCKVKGGLRPDRNYTEPEKNLRKLVPTLRKPTKTLRKIYGNPKVRRDPGCGHTDLMATP